MTDRLTHRLAIHDLNADFAYFLDHDQVEPLADLFTEDAVYSNGPRLSYGRDEIAAFFRSRTAKGPRTARHFCSGLRIAFEDHDSARATSVWLTFAADAAAPIEDCSPFLVADFTDLYRLCADGRWRIEKRHIEPVFRNPAIALPGSR